jgi:hypothetical protein
MNTTIIFMNIKYYKCLGTDPTPVIAIPSRSSRILPNFQPLLCVFSTAREVLVFLMV